MQYKVKGYDETVENVDIRGELRKPGDIVELDPVDAALLVEEGKLEAVGEDGAARAKPKAGGKRQK